MPHRAKNPKYSSFWLLASGLLTLFICVTVLTACGANNSAKPTPTEVPPANKIDTVLADILARYRAEGFEAARNAARANGLLDDQDRVRFAVTATEASAVPSLIDWLKNKGATVTASYQDYITARIELDRLTKLAGDKDFWQEAADLKTVRSIKFLLTPPPDWSGLAQTAPNAPNQNQGVAKVGADKWQAVGFSGKGVKIGIIDGGFSGYRSYLGNVLPPATQVTFKSFIYGGSEGRDKHGLAVAEVIKSYAPDVQLFLTPIEDEIGFAQAADWLVEQGVKIIHASLAWGGLWPGDGSGLMNERLDAARAKGVLPIVSVGNYGQGHYMGQFKPDSQNFNIFSNNKTTLKLTTAAASSWVALRWDEKWSDPQTNLDLYLLDANMQPLASSRNSQGANSSKPPLELAPFVPKSGQPVYVQVRLAGALPPQGVKFHLFAYNANLEESTPQQSVATPGDAKGALSVGATFWQDDKLESYSSRGPTADGRAKPEFVAPTGIGNRIFGESGQIFSGTSAAAPQVSGAAALVWSAVPNLKADEMIKYLRRNVFNLTVTPASATPGTSRMTLPVDAEFGFGRVQLGTVEAAANGSVAELLGAVPAGAAWQDDFSSKDTVSGLPDNNRAFYGKLPDGTGAYFVGIDEAGIINWNVYDKRIFGEFRAEFSVKPPAQNDPSLFYGLVFWQRDNANYFLFGLAGNNFAILQRNNNQWREITPWQSDVTLAKLPLRVALEATNGYLHVKIGDKVVGSVSFENFDKINNQKIVPGGRLGFAVGRFDYKPKNNAVAGRANDLQVIFSNLVVTPLTSQ